MSGFGEFDYEELGAIYDALDDDDDGGLDAYLPVDSRPMVNNRVGAYSSIYDGPHVDDHGVRTTVCIRSNGTKFVVKVYKSQSGHIRSTEITELED